MTTIYRGGTKFVWALGLLMTLAAGFASVPGLMAPAQAQQTAVYNAIVVRGNLRIEETTIRNFAALPARKPLTPGQINAGYQRLVATGLFEEVEIIPSGNSLVINVKEYPTINRINFERNKKIKDDQLAELITSRPRHTYSPAQAEADAALIIDAYRQAGRHTAEVKPKIIRRSDNRVDLVFEIFEGKSVEIQRLSFVGNRDFSDRRLRRILSTKQAGLLRSFIKSDSFVADRIEFDKQVLRDFYLSRGYVDFEVLSVSSEVVRERNGFFLTFKLREGVSYNFGALTTTSGLAEIDPDEFQAVMRLSSGDTYSPFKVEQVIARMETLATRKGLNFIRVTPRVVRHDENQTIDLEFVIERGPRIFVERIDIEGNVTTLDQVIRRQFTTVEGDPFNPREIREAADRIRALGFFAKSDVTTREGSSPDRVIVDVDVEEQPTGSFSFGVSYGASTGVGATLSLSESNFLGRGQFIKAEIGGATASRNYELAFAEPFFLGRNLRLGFAGYLRNTTHQNASYDTSITGFTPTLSFPLSENGRLELSYLWSRNQVLNTDTTASALITDGVRTSSSVGFTYSFDNVLGGINPLAGTTFRITQEFAGLGGTASFSKTTALLGMRTNIINDEISISAELEGGILASFGGTASHITDRFFMGNRVMRGFGPNGIGPREQGALANTDALGGNYFAVARFEANFPIGLPEEYGISGGIFYDVGSLWGLDDTAGGLVGADPLDDSFQLRSVIGVSIFWETAVGPLRFNFSQPLSGPAYDQTETFSLTIGRRF